MVTLRKRPRTLETPVNPKQTTTINNNNNNHEQQSTQETGVSSGYEQCREQRIKENMERMQKLGLFDLSSKLKLASPHPAKRSHLKKNFSQPSPSPSRRSSRLQSVTPISYSELSDEKRIYDQAKGTKPRGTRIGRLVEPWVGEGSRPEIYTEEHEKLLGSCEGTWTLYVDGIGSDGKRIYDQVKGKTCHQCRQKTLGHRTQCSTCNLVQGQFCGDCLYMRYGEHVLEVNKNPNWICPGCRGICNCSLCRRAKGWPATGSLYRSVSALGFKSVAHYLIQTKRAETKSGDVGTDDPISAEDKDSLGSDKKGSELKGETKESINLDSVHTVRNVKEDESKGEKELVKEHSVSNVASVCEANSDCIARRLRPRLNKSDTNYSNKSQSTTKTKSDGIGIENSVSVKRSLLFANTEVAEYKDSFSSDERHAVSNVASGTKTKRKGKAVIVNEPNPDSISGRLRQRRNRS